MFHALLRIVSSDIFCIDHHIKDFANRIRCTKNGGVASLVGFQIEHKRSFMSKAKLNELKKITFFSILFNFDKKLGHCDQSKFKSFIEPSTTILISFL